MADDPTEPSAKQRTNDRKVRQLIARQKRGHPATIPEVMKLCRYRSLLVRSGISLTPDTRPTCVVAALGFVPEDFSDRMRTDILTALHAGEVVMLVANRAELRNYAKREIALAMRAIQGTA
jgi:hypothetical protein